MYGTYMYISYSRRSAAGSARTEVTSKQRTDTYAHNNVVVAVAVAVAVVVVVAAVGCRSILYVKNCVFSGIFVP